MRKQSHWVWRFLLNKKLIAINFDLQILCLFIFYKRSQKKTFKKINNYNNNICTINLMSLNQKTNYHTVIKEYDLIMNSLIQYYKFVSNKANEICI